MATLSAKARYFVAKCGSVDSLRRCVTMEKWASRPRLNPPQPHETLALAFSQGPVILVFSVNNCHGWHGYCHMKSPPENDSAVLNYDGVVGPHKGSMETAARDGVKTEGNSGMIDTCDFDREKSVNEHTSKYNHDQQCFAIPDGPPVQLAEEVASGIERHGSVQGSVGAHSCTDGSVTTITALDPSSSRSISDASTTSDPDPRRNSANCSDRTDAVSTWHYFRVKWQTEFISSFGEVCLPSSKTSSFDLPDGTPLNKARNWQEMSTDIGEEVCALLDVMYADLVENRTQREQAKLAAKPPPFISMEGDVQEESEQYWKSIVEKVELELGLVHLACPFGSQRYNVQQPDSDIDAFIVYQAHTRDLLGFNPPKMTVKNSDREKCDYTVLEMKRYCELLLAYDARCIETLFLDDSTIVQASQQWRQLQKLRQQFLTKKCLDKYLGDALGSNGVQKLQRTLENSTVTGEQPPPPRIAKLIYIIVRLLQNAVHIVRGGPLQVFRPAGSGERDILLRIRSADVTVDEAKAVIQGLQEEISEGKENLTAELSTTQTDLESWLLSLRFHDFQMYLPL